MRRCDAWRLVRVRTRVRTRVRVRARARVGVRLLLGTRRPAVVVELLRPVDPGNGRRARGTRLLDRGKVGCRKGRDGQNAPTLPIRSLEVGTDLHLDSMRRGPSEDVRGLVHSK